MAIGLAEFLIVIRVSAVHGPSLKAVKSNDECWLVARFKEKPKLWSVPRCMEDGLG